jgi:hypothetical protein
MKIIRIYPEYKDVDDALHWWNRLSERSQATLRRRYNIKPRHIKGNCFKSILFTEIIEMWKKNELLPLNEKIGWAFNKSIDR